MDVGFIVRNSGRRAIDAVRDVPRLAEDLGYRSVWFTDHVIGMDAYAPVYEKEWAESLTSLSYVAAATERVKIGTSILVLPYRDPVYTAKVLATADQLSGGRLIVGVGAGWTRREYIALGRGHLFEERGEALDEALDLLTACWSGGSVAWSGKHFQVPTVEFAPVPAQSPRPPLWIGGNGLKAVQRAARVGDGWHPSNLELDKYAELSRRIPDLTDRTITLTLRLGLEGPDVPGLASRLDEYEALGCEAVAISCLDWDYDVQVETVRAVASALALDR
jgi:probable F420-dependent oxidoreductase